MPDTEFNERISQLTIDPEFKDLIPPLTAEEYNTLEQSIMAEGCRDAIVLWNNVIVDGHNRYAICKKHGIPFNAVQKEFPSRNDAIIWIVKNQLARRNLPSYEQVRLRLRLKPIIAAMAKERMYAGTANPTKNSWEGSQEPMNDLPNPLQNLGEGQGEANALADTPKPKSAYKRTQEALSVLKEIRQNSVEGDARNESTRASALFNNTVTRNQQAQPTKSQVSKSTARHANETNAVIAKASGVSQDTVAKVEVLEAKATDEMKQRLRSGDISINSAYQQVKRLETEERREVERKENAAKVEALSTPLDAQGLFQTIVIDPPWDWGDEGDVNQFGRAKPDYHTMPIEDIKALPIGKIADENCHIYLWVTNRSLPKAFDLLEAWGFRYITCLTWVKPSIGMGNYFRGSTEQILFGVKGKQPLKRHDVGTSFTAPRGDRHSAKPDEFYRLVESCSYGPYIDIFGRKGRDGWSVWGENG